MAEFIMGFFEGAHDANFVARLLVESADFSDEKITVSDLPPPIDKFVVQLYQEGNVEELTIGRPEDKLTPSLALRRVNAAQYFLGFVTGGCDNVAAAHKLITSMMSFARPDDIGELAGGRHSFAIVFFYDADSHGTPATEERFAEAYGPLLRSFDSALTFPTHGAWSKVAGVPLGLYVFCDGSGFGTLEDCVLGILGAQQDAITAANGYLSNFNVDLPLVPEEGADLVAARAKSQKALMTILGQREKALAGSSLAVVLRKSNMFNGVFDFQVDSTAKRIRELTGIAFGPPVSPDIG